MWACRLTPKGRQEWHSRRILLKIWKSFMNLPRIACPRWCSQDRFVQAAAFLIAVVASALSGRAVVVEG
jgi:hypothetical protein